MAVFQFRFAQVLEVKAYRRQRAEETHRLCLQEYREAQMRVEQAARQAEMALRQAQEASLLTIAQLENAVGLAKWWRERLGQAQQHAELLAGQLEEARQRLLVATKEEKMLEKLHEKHREQHHANEVAAQQLLLDDLSNIAHIRSRRGSMVPRENAGHGSK